MFVKESVKLGDFGIASLVVLILGFEFFDFFFIMCTYQLQEMVDVR